MNMILPEDIDVNTAGASLGRVQKGDHQNLNVCGRYEKKLQLRRITENRRWNRYNGRSVERALQGAVQPKANCT